jgi:hypothetical protein
MKKIQLKIIPSVNAKDIIRFVLVNTNPDVEILTDEWSYAWNKSFSTFQKEMQHMDNLPEQMKVFAGGFDKHGEPIDGFIALVVVAELKFNGWIKKFAETQEIKEDFYILFTN